MRTNRLALIIIIIIISLQCSVSTFYWKNESQNQEYEKSVTLWSSLEGQAGSRYAVNQQSPVMSQTFVNQHEQLNEIVVFFYNCQATDSGRVYTRIKDGQGKIYYEYVFEPFYMDVDTFCLTAHPEEGTVFAEDEEYIIEISVENMEADDYIEVGTTINASKPSVFKELEDGSTLFTKLDYTYIDTRGLENNIKTIAMICVAADVLLILVYMWIAMRRKKTVGAVILAGAVVLVAVVVSKYYIASHKWYAQNAYVVHAMGSIDGKSYSNSGEAFELSYQGGHKVFEVDFAMTSDNEIVLKHDWTNSHGLPEFENGTIPTLAEFKEAKIWNQYTTLDIEDLLQLMVEYPDIYIVTDSKSSNYKDVVAQFTRIAEVLQNYSESQRKSIMKRFIIQIYNDDMYAGIESIIHFDNYIYTLYQRGCENLDALGEFCVENEIPVIVLPYNWWTEEIDAKLRSYGLEVWIHTLNQKEDIAMFRDKGIDGVYTDVADLDELVEFK